MIQLLDSPFDSLTVGNPAIKSLALQEGLRWNNVFGLSSGTIWGELAFAHISSGKVTQQPLGSIESGTDD